MSPRQGPWILAGTTLTLLAANRWGLPELSWIATAPFLVVAGRARGRDWLGLALGVTVGQTLAVAKILSSPLPPAMALVFGLPMAVGALLLLGLWRLARDRAGAGAALYAWPALVALSDWAGFATSELSAWTTSANGVATHPVWMQLTALGGMGLLGAVVAWPSAWLATVWLEGELRPWRIHGAAGLALLSLLAGYGVWRLDRAADLGGPSLRVAAVTTDLGLGAGGPPGEAELLANDEALFARSAEAVARGARVVAWNEAASFVPPAREAALLARGAAFARDQDVDLILAYAVPISADPLQFRNEYAWFGPEGEIRHYAKHHPVPGEPSVKGEGPLQVVDRPWGRAGGAICYDWDFPATARAFATQGAGLVFVPSSDWRGIDPLHTQMAAVRAVEGGLSVLRPVRAAASAGFDPYGRARGWMNAGAGVLVVDLPTRPLPTLYARLGDLPVLAAASLVLAAVLGRALARRFGPGARARG